MINWIKNLFRKKVEPIEIPTKYAIARNQTQAIATVTNYALTEGKIYDVSFDTYSDGSISWFLFTRDDGHTDSSHNWRFKLLSEHRAEQIHKILEDD